MAITLKIGSPVEGADFYGRQRELEVAQRRLLGNNLMLSAPRRVGKTSFARKLLTCMKEQGWNTIFLNLEGINSVPAFFQTIYNELLELPNIKKHQQLVAKIKQAIERYLPTELSASVAGIGAKVVMPQVDSQDFERLQTIIKEIEENTLIVLDELTVFLERILKTAGNENDDGVVRDFLHQFRALRQQTENQCRWIVASSIGIRNFASQHQLTDTLNDFAEIPLGAFSPEEATGLTMALAEVEHITLPPAMVNYMLEKIGWNIPYFIQLIISRLPAHEVTREDIDTAYRELLMTSSFDTWSERLSKEYGQDEPAARVILDYLCLNAAGEERDDIYNRLVAKGKEITNERFSSLLMTLENDGYIGKTDSRRFFRSPLLRDYWKRKFCE